MLPVTSKFLTSLGYGHRPVNSCTVTVPGGAAVDLTIVAGSVSVDPAQRIRRRVESLELLGDSATFELVSRPGAIFRIRSGLSFSRSSSELVAVFTGEAQAPRQRFGGGTISLSLVDNANWLSRCKFLSPYLVAAGVGRVAAITAVVQFARPGTEVVDESGDPSVIAAQQMWTENALDVVADLTTDASLEGFFRADGVFVIRRAPTTLSPAVWSILPGRGGTLTSLDRLRPTDLYYNTVVAQPGARDGTQTWTDQVAQITDTADPLHPNYVGVVPLFLPLPTATSALQALQAAQTRLDLVRGRTESLLFGNLSNPALEAGDVIRVGSPTVNSDPAHTWQHFIDSFNFDLVSGLMSGQTRAQVFDG